MSKDFRERPQRSWITQKIYDIVKIGKKVNLLSYNTWQPSIRRGLTPLISRRGKNEVSVLESHRRSLGAEEMKDVVLQDRAACGCMQRASAGLHPPHHLHYRSSNHEACTVRALFNRVRQKPKAKRTQWVHNNSEISPGVWKILMRNTK